MTYERMSWEFPSAVLQHNTEYRNSYVVRIRMDPEELCVMHTTHGKIKFMSVTAMHSYNKYVTDNDKLRIETLIKMRSAQNSSTS